MKLLILIITLVLAAPYSSLYADSAKLTKLKLGLNWKAEPEFGGFYAAQTEDLYKKNGLDVEIQQGGAGTPTVQMLSAGTIDFGIVSGDELLISRSQKQDLIAVYASFQTAPYMIMTRKKLGMKSLDEVFKSKLTLSIIRGLPFASYLEKKYGFKNVKVVPYSGGIASFLSDEKFAQQGFVSSEPLLAKKQKVDVDTFMVSDAGYNPYVVVLAVREMFMNANPDVVAKMVKAVREGWDLYEKNPEKTNRLIAELNPTMDVATLKDMAVVESKLVRGKLGKKDPLGTMTDERWQQNIDQLTELGLLKDKVAAKSAYKNF